jgi:hypothetical protein
MPVIVDKSMHHMRIECEGTPTPLYCAVAMESVQDTREACNLEIFQAGWRLDGRRTLCAACVKRLESKRK